MDFTEEDFWNITEDSVKMSLKLLKRWGGRDLALMDKAIDILQEIVDNGSNSIRQTIQQQSITESATESASLSEPVPEPVKEVASPSWSNHQLYMNNNSNNNSNNNNNYYPVDNSMESHWIRIDDNVLQIPIKNNKTVTCIAVTTEEGLDAVIRDIMQTQWIAIDCEMLGVKKNLPELKLLQIGVSPTKGYAIQVDIIGFEILDRKLKPILEDESTNIIGWSYRSDGMAIESFFKKISQAPVLDLQAKLRPIAVSELNLFTAMEEYASAWDGIDEFRVAKRYGDTFLFTDNNCVWLNNPLPPKALVYAVFDVLSVQALFEYTRHYPDAEKFYWPYTITKTDNTKAIDNWYRQRHKAVTAAPYTPPAQASSSTQPPPTASRSRPHNGKKRDKYAVHIPVELEQEPDKEDGYDDNDARHQLEMQKAISLSLKESYPSDKKKVPTEDRVIGDLDETDTIQTIYHQELPKEPEVVRNTWGEVNLDTSPFIGNNFASPVLQHQQTPSINSPKYNQRSPTMNHSSSHRSSSQNQYQYDNNYNSQRNSRPNNHRYSNSYSNNNNNYSNNYNNSSSNGSYENKRFSSRSVGSPSNSFTQPQASSSPQAQTSKHLQAPNNHETPTVSNEFPMKPSKDKHYDIHTGGVAPHQAVSFAYSEPDATGSTAASWKSFANSTIETWKQGIDTEVEDMEAKFKSSVAASPSAKKEAKMKDGDSWTIEEDKPDIMTIPLKQIPVRKVFTGPRVMNPTVDDDDDDSSSSSSSESEDESSKKKKKSGGDMFGVKVTSKMKVKQPKEKEKKFRIEKLPIFVDDLYLYGQYGADQLAMLKLTEFEHLDLIHIPEKPFNVTVGYHMVDVKGQSVLKALQLYLSTGESYTCVLEQACLLSNKDAVRKTKFGNLLADPNIKRICWCPDYFEQQMIDRLGFAMGPTVDLADKINYNRPESKWLSFKTAIPEILGEWPDIEQYDDLKAEYEQLNTSRKFAGSAWDRDKLPEVVLKYSALQGLACYCLYDITKTNGLNDEDFLWPCE